MLTKNINSVASMLLFSLQIITFVYAEDFSITTESSHEDQDIDVACRIAFDQAEAEAMQKIDDYFAGTTTPQGKTQLIQQRETRTDTNEGNQHCTFSGTWLASVENSASDLIGTEQSIEGEYSASCSRSNQNSHCWSQIVAQAKQDLRNNLEDNHVNLQGIHLHYLFFEGRDREYERNHYSDRTATGVFYFQVTEADDIEQGDTYPEEYRFSETRPTPEDFSDSQSPEDEEPTKNTVDFTLSYTWDHNNRADLNEVAISSDRWGIGIWTNNQIGFAAFLGTDTVGIGDRNETVNNVSGDYKTLGIGLGHRLFDNHAITIENIIYYVDATPYKTTVAPTCDQCKPQRFQSENYLQATSNIKTNTHGVNIGWMFTWKWLERQSHLNHWSSGFYLELQL